VAEVLHLFQALAHAAGPNSIGVRRRKQDSRTGVHDGAAAAAIALMDVETLDEFGTLPAAKETSHRGIKLDACHGTRIRAGEARWRSPRSANRATKWTHPAGLQEALRGRRGILCR